MNLPKTRLLITFRSPGPITLILECETRNPAPLSVAITEVMITLAGGRCAVFELHGWVSPRDEITDGVALIERVEQIADFRGFPNEGALDFRDGDLTRFHPSEQGLDRVRRDGIALSRHRLFAHFQQVIQ